ncbi:MAG TPA: alpha/beta hydrolase [Vicinamibacterales bacterium]|nr:alpha/beta hydrolase [Vicinamibacterales bacterium]
MKARISTSTDPVMLQLTSPKGIRVSFQKSGSGPALVLVHGGFSDHHTNWEFVEPLFRGQFTVYALARRNRGDTEATQGHTLLNEAQDVVALIRHVGEPVFLLGHSYGAQCAVNAARLVPALVRKLVLYEAPQPSIMSPATLAALETLAADGAWDAFSFAFFHDVLRVPVADLEALRATDLWPPIVADAPASLGDLRALSGHPFSAAAFRGLLMPVCLQFGSESDRDLYVTDALAAVLPHARLQALAGQAHEGMTTAPEMYAAAVTEFLLA